MAYQGASQALIDRLLASLDAYTLVSLPGLTRQSIGKSSFLMDARLTRG